MNFGIVSRFAASLALALAAVAPGQAAADPLQTAFDSTLGTEVRAPQDFSARYNSALARQIAQVADGSRGRIGVAAIDLVTGEEVAVLGDQRFPMASTSKIAIAIGCPSGPMTIPTSLEVLLSEPVLCATVTPSGS